MIDEMRLACYAARILTGDFRAASTAHAFDAATIGGARIVRRPDLGRIAVGCRADFSLVDTTHPYMRPVHDPLRSLVYSASERAVRDVYVEGEQVVRNGEVLTIDVEAALSIARAQRRRWRRRPKARRGTTVDKCAAHLIEAGGAATTPRDPENLDQPPRIPSPASVISSRVTSFMRSGDGRLARLPRRRALAQSAQRRAARITAMIG